MRRLARRPDGAPQGRRLLALAAIYDGASRSAAAEIGAVSLQTVWDWVLRFNRDGPDGLVERKAPGHPTELTDEHRSALREIVEQGPVPAAHGVVRRRLVDLMQWLSDEFGVSLSEPTMSRELRALGFRKLSARPRHHAQNEAAVAALKRASPPKWRRSARRSATA